MNAKSLDLNHVKCIKKNLSNTIIELEKEYEIIEIETIFNLLGNFDYFKITIKDINNAKTNHRNN